MARKQALQKKKKQKLEKKKTRKNKRNIQSRTKHWFLSMLTGYQKHKHTLNNYEGDHMNS